MEAIRDLTKIDFPSLFISVFVILIGIKAIVSVFEWLVRKLGLETRQMRRRQEEHRLLLQMKEALAKTQDEIKQFGENRLHDRQQSFQIQKELTDSIKCIADAASARDEQINSLMLAQREILADRINQKYKYYIGLKGIPEDEADEFTNLHFAYQQIGGNHMGDAKYEYCINHLPVIPVETKLKLDKE